MTATPMSLFDQISEVGDTSLSVAPAPASEARRARRSDPQTSHAAAESIAPVLHVELRRVLAALEQLHAAEDQEATTGAINRVLGDRQRNCTARRITDLVDRGLVRKSGRTHREKRTGARDEIVWEPVRSNSDAPAVMGGESAEPGPHAPGPALHPCLRCDGDGHLTCAHHGSGVDCGCPLWECPDCAGSGALSVGGPDAGSSPASAGTADSPTAGAR